MLTLLIVDNETPQDIDTLTGEFNIVNASSSYDEAFAQFLTYKPEMILINKNFNQSDKLCKKFKEHSPLCTIIFTSKINTLDEKLLCYDYGADDFIPQPFNIKELSFRLSNTKRFHETKINMSKEIEFGREIAFNVMTEAAQYGYINEFFKNMIKCTETITLAKEFFELMSKMDLKTSIQFRIAGETDSYDYSGLRCTPIEENLFELLYRSGRLFDFANRTILNDKHVSFLIKNMPLDDEILHGRIRDLTAVIIEGLEEKAKDIGRIHILYESFNKLTSLVSLIKNDIKDYDSKHKADINNLLLEIKSSFHDLDLTLEQEEFYTNIIEKTLNEIIDSSSNRDNILNVLEQMIFDINKSLR